jgi:hypothetical protein
MTLEQIINLKLNNFEIKVPKKMADLEESCWPGYIAIGTKELDGKTVPNCVPEDKVEQSKEKFVIPSPNPDETESDYMGRCISEISGEYEHEQSIAICIGKWQEK